MLQHAMRKFHPPHKQMRQVSKMLGGQKQIKSINVKRRCQRATAASAHRDVRSPTVGDRREDVMPKFYFHLSNCDECFPDDIGYDLPDISVAHTRAERLANLVMTTSRLSSYPFDWRRWTVTVVTDDSQGAILIIPFSAFGNATRAALSAFVPADRAALSAPSHK